MRNRDFKSLQDALADLNRRIAKYTTEMNEGKQIHEERVGAQKKTILHLEGDLESLKKNVHERQQEGIKVSDDIQSLKR